MEPSMRDCCFGAATPESAGATSSAVVMRCKRGSRLKGRVWRYGKTPRHRKNWCIYTTVLRNCDKSAAQFQPSNDFVARTRGLRLIELLARATLSSRLAAGADDLDV